MTAPGRPQTDAAIVGEDTLALWMAQYGAALRRYFARRVGPADADDLVQEVFLSLQRSANESAVENVEAFLFTVARRVLIARYRGGKAYAFLEFSDALPDESDDMSPERILAAKQDYSRAIVAILSLSAREQTIFMLHHFSKMSYSAIARRMGVSKRTVRGIMERAIAKIAAHVRKEP